MECNECAMYQRDSVTQRNNEFSHLHSKMADKLVGDYSGSLFLTDNRQDMIKNCCNNCDKLERELQEILDELKSV
jgi:hypothetical protein